MNLLEVIDGCFSDVADSTQPCMAFWVTKLAWSLVMARGRRKESFVRLLAENGGFPIGFQFR